jgi:hypothetical protein
MDWPLLGIGIALMALGVMLLLEVYDQWET